MSETKLKIKFLDKYKSFKKGESFDNLEGDLIVLSGINAVGKSQLLHAMSDEWIELKEIPFRSKKIVTTKIDIKQNDTKLNSSQICLLTFERAFEYKNDFLNASNQGLAKIKLQVWTFYKNNILNKTKSLQRDSNNHYAASHENNSIDEPLLFNYDEIDNLISLLIDKYGVDKTCDLSQADVEVVLGDDFEWSNNQSDKKLYTKIGKIFLNYVNCRDFEKTHCVLHKDSKLNEKKYDDDEWKNNAPWTKLNDLFKSLKFKYHFLDDYQKDRQGISLTNSVGLIDNETNEERHLKDLSDGEKTLLDLALTSFEFENKEIKLVLFDEYDAFLNPSIINSFYQIVNQFFKQYQKIIVTHHLTTIFQAPTNAKFYELIIDNDKKHKIIPVIKEQYSDMKWFIENLSHPDRASFLNSPLIIVSEGTNIEYLKHILINVYKIPNASNFWYWNGAGKDEIVKNVDNFKKFNKKVLLIWDCDAEETCKRYETELHADEDNQNVITYYFKRNKNNQNIVSGIENMFNSDITDKFLNNGKLCKKKMMKSIMNSTKIDEFTNFGELIDLIKSILS